MSQTKASANATSLIVAKKNKKRTQAIKDNKAFINTQQEQQKEQQKEGVIGTTGKTIVYDGRTLYQVCAAVNIDEDRFYEEVKVGDVGGYVENPHNIGSDCWVDKSSKVLDNAVVSGETYIANSSIVSGNAKVTNRSIIANDSIVKDNAHVDHAAILGATVTDNARVAMYSDYDYSEVSDSHIGGEAEIVNSVVIKSTITAPIRLKDNWYYEKKIYLI